MTLADAAERRLQAGTSVDSLEGIWIDAALRTLASGTRCDPDVAVLRSLSEPGRAWSGLLMTNAEHWWDRIGRLIDCHYLAIAIGDTSWLGILAASWAQAPEAVGPWWPLRAQGEMALFTSHDGDTGGVWTPDDIETLQEESLLSREAPSDRAWVALAQGAYAAAREALPQYEARLNDAMRAWQQSPEKGLRDALSHPGSVLQTELRALQVLLERSE